MIDPKLIAIFNNHDYDASGTINAAELRDTLADCNVVKTEEELMKIMSEVDLDNSGELSLNEFVLIFGKAQLRKVFEEIDEDHSGSISTTELGDAMKKLGHKLKPSQIREILSKVDNDRSGDVNFEEFATFFQYVPAASLANVLDNWLAATHIDCGSDLAPPITSPDVPWYYGIFGGIGGILSRTLTAPLEKVKLQAQISTTPVHIVKELSSTYKEVGIRGLFAGNMANCIRVFPYAGVVTMCYLNGLKRFASENELDDSYEPIIRGCVAGCSGIIGQIFTYPIDIVRTRLTVNTNTPRRDGKSSVTILGSLVEIWKSEGIRGMYKGFVPTIAAVGPFLACQMVSADACKGYCSEKGIEVTTPVMVMISAFAGLTAQSVIYPLDVLRRRMQITSSANTVASINVVQDTTWLAMQKIVRKEGFRSLFSGILPTYLKVLPAVVIAMTTTKTLISESKKRME